MIGCTACGAEAVVQWRRRADARTEDTVPVYGCADHALSPDAAALLHEAACTGPGKNGACSCTPTDVGTPFEAESPRRMPPGW
ncbi:hypothetical protein ACFXD5_06585 [Streptomyces sp. NPDC059385]|uniref:hypothetical protein n=1 Tax=Streptomyces sp. NPDC059385 TaxID=3346817 RepID=UPI00369C9803